MTGPGAGPDSALSGVRDRHPIARRIALALVLLVAFLLRAVFSWPGPTSSRSYDERFSLPNIEALVRSHRFEPVNAFHPSLSYVPQALVLTAVEACRCLSLGTGTTSALARPREPSTTRPQDIPRRRDTTPPLSHVSRLGYRTCRLVSVVFGTLAVLVFQFLAARALASKWLGLACGAVLAFVPWLVWTAQCNEDAGFVLFYLLAALASLLAVRSPTPARFLVAGLCIGLALSAKLNGGPVALPLALWALASLRRDRGLFARLALAGAVALLVFLALNPHYLTSFDLVRRDFGHTLRDYAGKSKAQGESFLAAVGVGLISPASPGYLGGPLSWFAAVGAIGAFVSRRRPRSAARPSDLRFLLLFPLTYTVFYCLVTRNLTEHNWLPVFPFATILAVAGAADLASRLRERGRRGLAWVCIAAAFLGGSLVALRGTRFVFRAVVPATATVALRTLEPHARKGAQIVSDQPRDRSYVLQETRPGSLVTIPLSAGPAAQRRAQLHRADGWILDAGTARDLVGDEIVRGEPGSGDSPVDLALAARFPLSRGPDLRVRYFPWRLESQVQLAAGRIENSPTTTAVSLDLAPLAPPSGALLSLQFTVLGRARGLDCAVESGAGGRVAVQRLDTGSRRRNVRFSTERFDPPPSRRLLLRCSGSAATRAIGDVWARVWTHPAAGDHRSDRVRQP